MTRPTSSELSIWRAPSPGASPSTSAPRAYYGFMGEAASMVAGSAATDAATVAGYVEAFRQAGLDELVLFPCDPDPGQVDLLADAVLN